MRLKFAYSFYNFFNKKILKHNIAIYKNLGLNKKYYSPISSADFKNLKNKVNENLEVDNLKLQNTQLYKESLPETQQSLNTFNDKGFAILKNYLSENKVDEINSEIEKLQTEKKVKFNASKKIMFAIHQSKLLYNIGNDSRLIELLSVILNGKSILFQSINFLMGSEQHTHSDSIHMTTYPLGGLLGVWIALEDITEENGPLHYYPGSHKLPYYLNSDYDNEGTKFLIGDKDYSAYEKMLEQKITEHKIEKQVFLAKKGDLLIWHANLMHGGEAHTNKNKTRKSMVLHYFKEGVVCYHEITQRPALIKSI